jgi:hypothetical protein
MQCTTGITLEAFPLRAVKAGAKMGAPTFDGALLIRLGARDGRRDLVVVARLNPAQEFLRSVA